MYFPLTQFIVQSPATSNPKYVLSEFTGRLLFEKINAVQNACQLTVANYTAANFNNIATATSNPKYVLSEYTGRLLFEKINAVDAKIKNAATNTNTETWQFTLTNGTTVTKKVVLQ